MGGTVRWWVGVVGLLGRGVVRGLSLWGLKEVGGGWWRGCGWAVRCGAEDSGVEGLRLGVVADFPFPVFDTEEHSKHRCQTMSYDLWLLVLIKVSVLVQVFTSLIQRVKV